MLDSVEFSGVIYLSTYVNTLVPTAVSTAFNKLVKSLSILITIAILRDESRKVKCLVISVLSRNQL